MRRLFAILALLLLPHAGLADGGRIVGARVLAFEPSSRNIALQSEGVSTATWPASNLTAALPTVTANASACPVPGAPTTAERIALPAVASAQYSMVSQNVGPLASGATYTLSAWIKSVSGSTSIPYALSDFTSAGSLKGFFTASTLAWTRVTITGVLPNGNTRYIVLGSDVRPGNTNQSASSATTFDICAVQLEPRLAATRYIPTAASALSRSARPWR